MSSETALPPTESADPRYRDLDAWPIPVALDALLDAQLSAVAAVRAALPALAEAVAAAAAALALGGGRLIYAGAGTSGRIAAQDGAELPPTFDWPRDRLAMVMAGGPAAFTEAAEGAEDDAAAAVVKMTELGATARDVVLAVAASGNTAFTCAALEAAGRRGAITIGIANNPAGRLLALARYPVLLATGAEPLAGSTRLKAGTAQKAALNLFSTQLMSALGGVHRGLMVDMRASNAKLRARALRMLRHLTGADEAAALAALDASGWRVKHAVLALRGLDGAAADALLARSGNVLRAALQELDR